MQFSKNSLAALKDVHPLLVKLLTEAIKNSPVDFVITDGVRTTEQQRALYAKGRTTPGDIVTKADGIKNKSKHQVHEDGFGYAVDLYPYVNGKIDFNDSANRMKAIADHIKAVAKVLGISVIWGGDWTVKKEGLVDKPHFQII